MANEAQIRVSLAIKKGKIDYQNKPGAYQADVAGLNGPAPGTVTATTGGVNVDLSMFTTPGLCCLKNIDDTNFVTYGIHDGTNFHPFGELLPGEEAVVRLSRDILGGTNELHVVGDTASVKVQVDAFEA